MKINNIPIWADTRSVKDFSLDSQNFADISRYYFCLLFAVTKNNSKSFIS